MAAEMSLPEGGPKDVKNSQCKLQKTEILTDWTKRAEIIAQKKTVKYGPILISAVPQSEWQINISITRKVKGAVQRNRIKRIIREAYRQSKPVIIQPHAFVFTVTSNFDSLDFHRLHTLLTTHYGQSDESN